MRVLLRGFLAGVLLSCLRAPLGLDLFQVPAVAAGTAYGWRAAALAVVGIGLFLAAQGGCSASLLLAIALGVGVHGLLLANAWTPGSSFALAATAAVGLALIASVRPSAVERGSSSASPPRFLEMLGIAAAAAGSSMALEGIARHVRLFGGTMSQDDSVFAFVLAALIAVGAASFGWISASAKLRGLGLPAGLTAGASAGLVSLVVLSQVSEPRGLNVYLDSFRLNTAEQGMLSFDALISAACFVAPGLLLGAAFLGARHRLELLSVCVGAGLGLVLVPGFLTVDPGRLSGDVQPASAELIPIGTMVASAGALLAILSLAHRGGIARWLGIAVALALAVPALFLEHGQRLVLSPWAKRQTFPLTVSDTPEGLISVESVGLADTSWSHATLDRRHLTPTYEEASADAARLRASFELLPLEVRARRGVKVLLVGQLSPARARVLTDSGAGSVDRTAVWSPSMANIEQTLWKCAPLERPPPGGILTVSTARERFRGGSYDLVIVPAVPGEAPRIGDVDAPLTTTLVRWVDIGNPVHQLRFGGPVAITLDGLEMPALAALTHAANPGSGGPEAPVVLAEGSPRRPPAPITWLRKRASERWNPRAEAARTALFARLAEAARGGPLENLTSGLDIFYSAQVASSQFESPEDRTELPTAALDRFLAAALAGPPEPFLRRLWEAIARILTGKRWVEEAYGYLEPVAKANRPWPALEKALARADLESLEPRDAIERLEGLSLALAEDFELWYLLGEAQCAAGLGPAALDSWRRAAPLETSDRAARRKVALALFRAGDPAGRDAAIRLLIEFPDDHELKEALEQPFGSGPLADPCQR